MSRVVCVFREGEDYSRRMNEWLEDFRRRTGKEIEVVNPDLEESFCRAYDIVEYPTIIALRDDSSVLAMWRGTMLPLFDEVLYYMI